MATSYDRLRPLSEITLRVETLLSRYPNLSEQELGELLDLYPRLNMLDQGLLTADDRLAPRLGAFHREHGWKLKAPVAGLIALLIVPALLAIVLLGWALT